jgi:hypothetical protein
MVVDRTGHVNMTRDAFYFLYLCPVCVHFDLGPVDRIVRVNVTGPVDFVALVDCIYACYSPSVIKA